jgi:hypothetical protein
LYRRARDRRRRRRCFHRGGQIRILLPDIGNTLFAESDKALSDLLDDRVGVLRKFRAHEPGQFIRIERGQRLIVAGSGLSGLFDLRDGVGQFLIYGVSAGGRGTGVGERSLLPGGAVGVDCSGDQVQQGGDIVETEFGRGAPHPANSRRRLQEILPLGGPALEVELPYERGHPANQLLGLEYPEAGFFFPLLNHGCGKRVDRHDGAVGKGKLNLSVFGLDSVAVENRLPHLADFNGSRAALDVGLSLKTGHFGHRTRGRCGKTRSDQQDQGDERYDG